MLNSSQNRIVAASAAAVAAKLAGAVALASLALATVAQTPAWAIASDVEIRHIGEDGENLDSPIASDDRYVAVLTYKQEETTKACGASKSELPYAMTVTVYSDGHYVGTTTTSQLQCGRRLKNRAIIRKSTVARHGGKLDNTELVALWGKITEFAPESRDPAAQQQAAVMGKVTIQRAKDLRGVLAKRDLQLFEQTGASAEQSARFMQTFIIEGKIN